MQYNSARAIEQICWSLRLGDYPRSLNRGRINSLANGAPPYSVEESERNGVEINVNDLSLTRLSHDARLQLSQAFEKPGNYFTGRTDAGAVSERMSRGIKVTNLINKVIKKNDPYYECQRSKRALTVLHGIGPSGWEDQDRWCPVEYGIEDILMPSNTKLSFRNLPFFAVWRGYTAAELIRITRHADKNPGWNMDLVQKSIDWVDEETSKLYVGSTWSEYWSPEKRVERQKQDSGIFASDLAPTVDCYDFYFWDDHGGKEGWRRRIIFDAYGGNSQWNAPSGYGENNKMPDKNLLGEKSDEGSPFLYSSGNRVVADDIHELVHFQFADLSAVAPFNYHSVRSLGFLLYAACHLQNRLRCKFSESVFENLMMYMRVKSLDEAERVLKIELAHKGIIDESVQFLSPAERWQPNPQMAEMGLNEFKQIIADNSSSQVSNQNMSRDRVEKTKFQVMAEVNAMQTLVSAGLQQCYRYQTTEYREIFRRFCKPNSTDPDVRNFRAQALRQGIPEKYLVSDAWEIEPERVMGSGNKTMEMAVAQQLMEWRTAYAPEGQQEILRIATLSITDDAAITDVLVPENPGISDDKHDAMLAFGALMAGAEVQFTKSQNRIELTTTLIGELAMSVQQTMKAGGVPTQERLQGMQNVTQHISQLVEEVAKDKPQKEMAKKLADASGKLANEIKGFAQRLAQQQKAQAQNGGQNGELKSKIMGRLIESKAKADNARESHASRTAQKQMSWEADEKRKQQDHQLEMRRKIHDVAVDTAAKDIQTEAEVKLAKKRASVKPKNESKS